MWDFKNIGQKTCPVLSPSKRNFFASNTFFWEQQHSSKNICSIAVKLFSFSHSDHFQKRYATFIQKNKYYLMNQASSQKRRGDGWPSNGSSMKHYKHFIWNYFVESFYGKCFWEKVCSTFIFNISNWIFKLLVNTAVFKERGFSDREKRMKITHYFLLPHLYFKGSNAYILGALFEWESWRAAVKRNGNDTHLDMGMIRSVWACGVQEKEAVEKRGYKWPEREICRQRCWIVISQFN